MPWSVSDVDKHKKGLSPADKKKWVNIANGIYKDCLARGGTDSSCAPKAIRITNSKFTEENMQTLKLTKGALCFTEVGSLAKVEQFEDGKIKKLSMTAYSGKIIPNHWYWGDLAIDTNGMKFAKPQLPILHDHMTDEKIGFGTFVINDKHEVVADETTFVDTPFAEEFIKLSGQGFPYEASIQGKPTKIVRLAEGEVTEVNGYTMKGPGTVWRESVLKECSVCTFGADGNTKSVAMSENEDVIVDVKETKKSSKGESDMKLDELKTAHPELFAEVILLGKVEGKTEAESSFAEAKTELEAKITALTADKTSLSATVQETATKVLGLEKQETLRKEQGILLSVEQIFSEIMVKSEIPERLRPKIRKQINHEVFVKDEKFDTEAFAAAVTKELADWLPKEGDEDAAILGMGSVKTFKAGDKDTDTMVARMLKSAGQEVTKH